jgi:hypothetical protein
MCEAHGSENLEKGRKTMFFGCLNHQNEFYDANRLLRVHGSNFKGTTPLKKYRQIGKHGNLET